MKSAAFIGVLAISARREGLFSGFRFYLTPEHNIAN